MTPFPPKPAPLDHEPEGKPEIDPHRVQRARQENAAAEAAQERDQRLGRLVHKMQEEVGQAEGAEGGAPAPRLGRVLLATDFAPPSVAAARWASRHLAPSEDVILLHVIDIPRPPRILGHPAEHYERSVRLAREGAARRLASLVPSLAGESLRTEVRAGNPAEQVASAAAADAADLIVVGAHAGPERYLGLLGSTVERLIHLSRIPLLLARGLPAEAPRTILVAVDESPAADAALRWAGLLGRRFGAKVVACHVLTLAERYASPGAGMKSGPRSGGQEPHERVREWLSGRIRKAGLDVEATEVVLMTGEPRHAVPAAAQQRGAELVVTGSRGTGTIRRHFVGSVTSAILRRTTLPVLVVPDPARSPKRGDGT